MVQKRNRLLSYGFGAAFIFSLFLIAVTSMKLIENYRENQELNALWDRIEEDSKSNDLTPGYYVNFDEDETLTDKFKDIIIFTNK